MSTTRTRDLMTITLEKAIEQYLITLGTEGKSPRYIGWLKERLGYFTKFIRKTRDETYSLRDLNVEDGRDFIRDLMERDVKYRDHPLIKPRSGKLSIQYIHGCGRAVRSFSTWASEEGYLDDNVMQRLKLPKLPKVFPEPLTEIQIKRVLDNCLYHTMEGQRNFTMMMLFFDTGLRLSELINLRISKIDLAMGEMNILGKGNKERKVPFGSQAKKAMIEYMAKHRPEPENPMDADRLFLNCDARPITPVVVAKVFERVKKATELNSFHPHLCRHTFAVRYLINGGDVFSLQKILGHSSLEMTRKYVNLASDDIKDKHRLYSPMDKLNFQTVRRGRPRDLNAGKPGYHVGS
jgi:site-specific recombinase XerD